MANKRVHILIAEPSLIIRSGLISVLQKATNLNIDVAEVSNIATLSEKLCQLLPDILIVNPMYLGTFSHNKLREFSENIRIIALQSTLMEQNSLANYEGIISIYDNTETIHNTLSEIISRGENAEIKAELSSREKEIVVCIAKGMSNKEIADALCRSTHTVISHRRNITAKLEIHSASGLTIYAIVNKLIEIDTLPFK